jgi:SAM-dependent methyltransferase
VSSTEFCDWAGFISSSRIDRQRSCFAELVDRSLALVSNEAVYCGLVSGTAITEYFDEGSPYLDTFSSDRIRREVDELVDLISSIPTRVLDAGCGHGGHAVELAARGADITGIDPSAAMISAARDRAQQAGQFVDFIQSSAQDFREIARYDLAVCLGTSFGQLPSADTSNEPHVAFLQGLKRALRPGAVVVIEVPDLDHALAEQARIDEPGAEPVAITNPSKRFNKRTSIMTERFESEPGGIYVQRYRLFAKTDLVDLLHDVGFVVQKVHDRGLVEPPAGMITVVAKNSG